MNGEGPLRAALNCLDDEPAPVVSTMLKTTTILVCLLLTIVLPGVQADPPAVGVTATTTTGGSCVTVNPSPTDPVELRNCTIQEEGSNIL